MAKSRIVGLFWVIATAGCTAVHAPPPPTPSPSPPGAVASKPQDAKSPGRAAAPPVATAPPPRKEAAAPVPAKSAAPTKAAAPAPLDLASLEQQLLQTKAIGVLTKIAIKNQVDDLLGQFRAYYEGSLKTTLAELRRPYELLLLKVLSLLQDGDPALARSIHQSREAIWGILADRGKFSKVQS